MKKFEDINILQALEQIVRLNTKFYAEDFRHDRDTLRKAAASSSGILLWMSRESGTYLFPEEEVAQRETYAHNTWCYYGRSNIPNVLAYALKLNPMNQREENLPVRGTIYPLDYAGHWKLIAENAVRVGSVVCTFENGRTESFPSDEYEQDWVSLVKQNGPIVSKRSFPKEEKQLQALLGRLENERSAAKPGDWGNYIKQLERACTECYEQQAKDSKIQMKL